MQTIYISDIEPWCRVSGANARPFGPHKPAHAGIPVGTSHHGCQVEIEAIAVRRNHES